MVREGKDAPRERCCRVADFCRRGFTLDREARTKQQRRRRRRRLRNSKSGMMTQKSRRRKRRRRKKLRKLKRVYEQEKTVKRQKLKGVLAGWGCVARRLQGCQPETSQACIRQRWAHSRRACLTHGAHHVLFSGARSLIRTRGLADVSAFFTSDAAPEGLLPRCFPRCLMNPRWNQP